MGGGGLDKLIIMLISAPVGFELGLGAELGNMGRPKLVQFLGSVYICTQRLLISLPSGGRIYRL